MVNQHKDLQHLSQKLTLLNPKNVLKRGYAIVRGENGVILMHAKTIKNQKEVTNFKKKISNFKFVHNTARFRVVKNPIILTKQ